MQPTYGQIKDGKVITYQDFSKEISQRLRRCIISNYVFSERLCRKLYKKGYSIEDACSFLILNSK